VRESGRKYAGLVDTIAKLEAVSRSEETGQLCIESLANNLTALRR